MPLFNTTLGACVLLLFGFTPDCGAIYWNPVYVKDLQQDLSQTYNRYMRPVTNDSMVVNVTMGIILRQVIDVDESRQVMTASILIRQKWHDPNLVWDPSQYGQVTDIYLPSLDVWLPDIVLYNNAEGGYELPKVTKVRVSSTGQVVWRAPMIIKSACDIDVRFFPFDDQTCEMKFGSWTYNKHEVAVYHVNLTQMDNRTNEIPEGVALSTSYTNVEWDLLRMPARFSLVHYAGECHEYMVWTFAISLRRKSKFYVVTLIIPVVCHAFLAAIVFYLPADGGKISLCLILFLSSSVFFLLFSEIFPQNSVSQPLLVTYLVFTLVLVLISIIVTAYVLSVRFRSLETHVMPDCIRKVFLYSLPRLLCMRRPLIENAHDVELKFIKLQVCTCLGSSAATVNQFAYKPARAPAPASVPEHLQISGNNIPDVPDAISSTVYIADHIKQEDESKRIKEDWKYVSMVIDRVVLIAYLTVCIGGSVIMSLLVPRLRVPQ